MPRFIVSRPQLGSRLVKVPANGYDHNRKTRPSLQRYFNFKAFAFFRVSSRLIKG